MQPQNLLHHFLPSFNRTLSIFGKCLIVNETLLERSTLPSNSLNKLLLFKMLFSSQLSWYNSWIPCMYEVYISLLKQTRLLASRRKEPTYRDLMSRTCSHYNVKKGESFTSLEWITLIWIHKRIFEGRSKHAYWPTLLCLIVGGRSNFKFWGKNPLKFI